MKKGKIISNKVTVITLKCGYFVLNLDVERIHLPESSLEPSRETVSHFTFLGMGITLLICIGCRLSVLLEFILLPMGLHEQFFKLIICDMKGSKSYFILS